MRSRLSRSTARSMPTACAALATAVAQAGRTYRAVIIDLTRVRALSAAGLHCLDCVGPVQDERQGVVHLVCAESSAVRGVLQQAQLQPSLAGASRSR